MNHTATILDSALTDLDLIEPSTLKLDFKLHQHKTKLFRSKHHHTATKLVSVERVLVHTEPQIQ